MSRVFDPASAPISGNPKLITLETQLGDVVRGFSFGAEKSAAGELVFQTGMVGYPEAITDPSYEGQILVMTYPLMGNYGVPDREIKDEIVPSLPKYFESKKIHVAGLVVASYTEKYSHYLAKSSLGQWLKEQGIPAVYGIDTRALTKQLRQHGSTLGRICIQKSQLSADKILKATESLVTGNAPRSTPCASPAGSVDSSINSSDLEEPEPVSWRQYFDIPEWIDPNTENLVAKVSLKQPIVYEPPSDVQKRLASTGKALRILAIDVGMKFNQIRCFVKRGVSLKVVPYDYDFSKEEYDGLFVSNGPGDPSVMGDVVKRLSKALEEAKTPIFGICLGHQLLARAAGATTIKLKFGNRGQNIPCTCSQSGRCYITSQNHGYAVDAATLPSNWEPLFTNANDGSNEGIFNTKKPIFSVQFHPEANPGPRDTEYLFDVFINAAADYEQTHILKPVTFPGGKAEENKQLHPKQDVKKVLVLGSGGLSIGQAGEFDYSGSQAIKALKEEGIYTILINPNIATIQTSKGMADKIYFLPVTPEFVRKVIIHERPDAIYCTFGGQTALNVGVKLRDEFNALGVKVLGTPIETIMKTEDRELFSEAMDEINEHCARSESADNLDQALKAAHDIGYPVICRAAYALGGLGSGFAYNDDELEELCEKAFAISPQVLVERSMKGWKEVEYEVVRDSYDNCITVCNMENFDPVGIHTGDSIVVAPSQTLSDADYMMLRATAVKVIRHLGVIGECNIQYSLNPKSKEYCIIEVNARLSRSSALASKATGYPLAYTAAKLGLNIPLTEIKNSVTKETCACFEPSLDYCVVKIPRWDLRKFNRVSTLLSSSMKSVGEVMSIGRNFEEAIQKAIRSVDPQHAGFDAKLSSMTTEELDQVLNEPTDQRIYAIAEALLKGYSVEKIHSMTHIDNWFLYKLETLIKFAKELQNYGKSSELASRRVLPVQMLRRAKQLGFEDRQIAEFLQSNEVAVRRIRKEAGILPYVKQIDTVAAEFPAFTNYLYVTYNASESDVDFDDNGVMVLGSGVYRIGSSVEFDWCAVRAIRTLRENGYKTIMVNFNPETVSTDYDEADRLYFETIDLERVLDIYELEKCSGVVISMGGQTSNNIALQLSRQNIHVLGTSPEMIDSAENRYKFSRMLDRIGVDQPAWKELTSFEEAAQFAKKVHFPVLVRPSYVLSGAAMNTCWSDDDLKNYLGQAVRVSPDYPVVITKYVENAKEIDVDAVANDGKLIMHVVAEHVENAGVHSGDATLMVPPQDLSKETVKRIVEATAKIGKALAITGPYNIQFMAKNNEIKVIECNVRASRSFPFNSKVVDVDMIEMATKAIMGLPVKPYPGHKLPDDYCAVKVPKFSFSRLSGADPVLGVEMASTGEVACFGHNRYEAYLKSLIASGFLLPKKNILLSIGSYKEKEELLPYIKKLYRMGYKLFATSGTADFIHEHNIPVKYLELLSADEDEQKSEYSLTEHLANNMIDLYINLPSANRFRRPANYISQGYRSRRMAVDFAVPLVTNVKCAKMLIEALSLHIDLEVGPIDSQSSHSTVELPGLVALSSLIPGLGDECTAKFFEQSTKVALASGFTFLSVLPYNSKGPALVDDRTLSHVHELLEDSPAFTDYSFSLAATEDNAELVQSASSDASSLFVKTDNFNEKDKVINISAHFSQWPLSKPIIVDAKKTDLASVLLLAALFGNRVHVTNVTEASDLALISMSKEKQLNVTCDVSVYALFLSQDEYPGATFLPTKEDQKTLWKNIDQIDCFSVGFLPTQLAKYLGKPISAGMGFSDVIPLLLSAVADKRLTVDDIIVKMHDTPIEILGIGNVNSVAEIDEDRRVASLKMAVSSCWSPFAGKNLKGAVERVIRNDETVCLEGEFVAKEALGREGLISAQHLSTLEAVTATSSKNASTSNSTSIPSSPVIGRGRRRSSRFSFEAGKRPILKAGFRPKDDNATTIGEIEHPTGADLVSSQPPRELAPPNAISSLIRSNDPFFRKSVLSVNGVSKSDLHALFGVAQEMKLGVKKEGVLDILKRRVLVTAFFEPSTRTASSFNTAMQRLGGRVVCVNGQSSSAKKGETLQDTIRTLACYADAIVLRHPSEDSAYIAAKYSPVPIINGGNGSREHPSQAFLDLFTIREELGTINGITVTFMGDLKYGRPVHSLIKLLRFYQVKVQLVSPKELRLPRNLVEFLRQHGKPVIESTELTKDIIAKSDVLYCTRVQQERFADKAEYERLKDSYIVDNKILSYAKQHMCVMHPLPRIHEIKEEVDFDQRAAYFREMQNGLYVRMALLAMVIGVDEF